MIKRYLSLCLLWACCLCMWGQSVDDGYGGDYHPSHPDDPAKPVATYRLTLTSTAGGTVGKSQWGEVFSEGTYMQIQAEAYTNYKFVHWLQNDSIISTEAVTYFTMPAQNVVLKAVFEFAPGGYGGDYNPSTPDDPAATQKRYTLSAVASPANGGSISQQSTKVAVGSSTYVQAHANNGYRFKGWKLEDELVSTEPRYHFVMTDGDVHLVAEFEYTPTMPGDPSEGGQVQTYTLQYRIDGYDYHSEQVAPGTPITPLPDAIRKGHTFNGWSNVPTTMPHNSVYINGSFTANTYQIQFVVDGEVLRTESLAYGSLITYPTTLPVVGYALYWPNSYTVMPDKDVVAYGQYKTNKYALIYLVDGVEYKRTELNPGETIYAEPAPNKEGHTFSGWSEIPETMPNHYVVVKGSFTPNQYTLTYMLDGEVYTSEQVEYGTTLIKPKAPAKEGHTFEGWSEIPKTMPAKDVVVYGTYRTNKYLIRFKVGNEIIASDSVLYGAAIVAPEAPTKEGSTFSGWKDLPDTMPAKNLTITGSFVVNGYTLTYVVDGEEYRSITFEYGAAITAEKAPQKEGHTFSGWSEIPKTMPAENVTITGSFTVNTYRVTFKVGNDIIATDSVEYGAKVNAPETPIKEGYTFGGWQGLPDTMPAKDVTVIGTFVVNGYTLTYMVDGEVYRTYAYEYGTTIVAERAPQKEGYTFSGWSEIPETMPAEDVTITGSFTINTYRVTFKVGNDIIATDSVEYGAKVNAPETPIKEGHTFGGWQGLPDTMPAKDVTVTGSFVVNGYTLTYMVDGEVYRTYAYEYGTTIVAERAPQKEGYTFSGWSEIPETMPAEDVTITGSFTINTYLVTFKVGNDIIATDSVEYGAKVNAPETPTKEGHTFGGWQGLPDTMPAKDVTVIGTFVVNGYTLTYMVDEEVYRTYAYEYGTTIVAERAPQKEGYTFSGWSEIPETMPAKDVTITGSFTINSYLVTFKIGQEVIQSDSLEYGATIVAPNAPDKEGYTFDGWQNVAETVPAKDVTYMGTYSINTYQITYMLDGEVYYTDSIVYASTVTPIENPEKEGYTFGGWQGVPETMPAEDVTITGQFNINSYTITYIVDGEVYKTVSYDYQAAVTLETEPVKEGYTFSGWDTSLDAMPAEDVTINGMFTINTYLVTFKIGDDIIASDSLTYGTTIVAPKAPEKEGHTFDGWQNVPETVPASDVTIEGTYTANTYTLTYLIDGMVYQWYEVRYGEEIPVPTTPTKEGHTFNRWLNPPKTMPAKDVTIFGIFDINKYLVTFKIGDDIIASDSLTYGTAIVAPEAPEKEGYTFNGWQDVPETVPASDVTIESSYTINTYIANYVVDDEVYQTFEVTYGEQIPETTPPTKTGHTFTGWSEIPGTMPAHDVTITAIFSVNQYLVTFKIGDEVIASESLDYGTAIQAPAAPAKEGYDFDGWKDLLETVPDHDVTIEGSYTIKQYVATYWVDEEVYETFNVTYGEGIPQVEDPVKKGHSFTGWSEIPETMPSHDVTITAGWRINQYTVNFVSDGTVVQSETLDYNTPITPPADPEKEGHTFIGWTPAVDEYVPDHDVTYQAKYEVNYYSITYYINDEAIYQEYMPYGDKIVEYVPELEEGNTFYGWDTEIPKTMPAYNVHIYGTAQYPVSINGVLNDSKQDIRVYNLQGKLIQIVKRQEEIKDLPTGIYIINGKKYIIP